MVMAGDQVATVPDRILQRKGASLRRLNPTEHRRRRPVRRTNWVADCQARMDSRAGWTEKVWVKAGSAKHGGEQK